MTQKHRPLDAMGQALNSGDEVLITRVPNELLRGLPTEDQRAIKGCVGQRLSISGFDDSGYAEIEFTDDQGNPHTIWICPDCLEKL